MRNILQFLSSLAMNNNREWFSEHKEEYLQCKNEYEKFVEQYIVGLSEIDERIVGISARDCIWRIYRDVRFSTDKRPYKEWFGAFPAPKLGKRSPMAGYYCHIQPGNSMFAAGIWGPEPKLLYHLRTEVIDNYEELEAIMRKKNFRKYFSDFDDTYSLKKVPLGFDANAPHADWAKRKCYTISTSFTDEQVCSSNFLQLLLDVSKIAKPVNDFLNYSYEQFVAEKTRL